MLQIKNPNNNLEAAIVCHKLIQDTFLLSDDRAYNVLSYDNRMTISNYDTNPVCGDLAILYLEIARCQLQ